MSYLKTVRTTFKNQTSKVAKEIASAEDAPSMDDMLGFFAVATGMNVEASTPVSSFEGILPDILSEIDDEFEVDTSGISGTDNAMTAGDLATAIINLITNS